MAQVNEAENIFGIKTQPLTFGEKKALKVAGEDAIVFQVDWQKHTIKVLLKNKNVWNL